VQRRDLVEDLQVIEPLGLALVMFAPAAWLAVAAAAAAAVVAAAVTELAVEGLFVPCNAEPIPSLHLPDCPHQYPQKPLGPYMEGHRLVATLAALSARFYAAPVLSSPGVSSLLPASVDPLRILPVTNSALTRPRPAIVKERRAAAPKAGSLTTALGPDWGESWPPGAVNRDEVYSSFVEDYLVEEEARQRSQRTETEKSQRKGSVKVSTHGSCCQTRSVTWD